MSPEKKLRWVFVILAGVILYGTLGYTFIEGWSALESFYMTIITLSTVGFGEVRALSATGRVFTIILVIFGVGGAAFTISVLGQFIVEGEIRRILGRRKMEKRLKDMKEHYIVCGYGRVGMQVCKEFFAREIPFVVIDKKAEVSEELVKKDVLKVTGDATFDKTLISAGVERAKALVSTIASESENVFITLSARELNPEIFITARAESKSAEKKLLRAGADRVVSPHEMGGLRMALVTLRPDIVDFMRIVTGDREKGFGIEEIEVKKNSSVADTLLKDSPIRCELGLLVIGMKKKGKEMIINPSAQTKIEPGDILVVIGENEKLEKLGQMTSA